MEIVVPIKPSPAFREKLLGLSALAAIVALAAWLRFANIDSLGYINHYYAAAVKSMLLSWHNFFFVAAEPGGSVSVDKPPLGLWLQAISAYFLGVNSLGLLLPEILAGLASVVVVYHLVRRSFGTLAGLLSALALAITPVVVAVDRNNTIDSTLILTLLLAAWAFIKATETGRLCWLLLGAALVGLAFNIKMLAAYLPVPAFFAMYFLGARESFWRKTGKLLLAGILMLVISLSWAVAVDLTPADQRPYVGSSGDNSVLSLIGGYNGISRLVGMARGGGMASAGGGPDSRFPAAGSRPTGMGPLPGGSGQLPARPQPGDGRQFPAGGPMGNRLPGGGGGAFNTGQAGPLRLFTAPLDKEAGWLLPAGLLGMLLLLAGSCLQWPLGPQHQALVLWGGWLVTAGVFFSVASFFHEYYLSLLGAPLAALVGIGIARLWDMRRQRPIVAPLLIVGLAAVTLVYQWYIASSFVQSIDWMVPALIAAVFALGAALLLTSLKAGLSPFFARAGMAVLVFAMLVTPGIWSYETAVGPGSNLSLPAAYSGGQAGPANRGGAQVNQALLDYLEAHTQGMTYLMAVPSSMQGADYVLATGRAVLYLGGFSGQDQVVTADELARLVRDGELRFVYLGGQAGGMQSGVSSWVASACAPVSGFDAATRNSGAPDGTGGGSASASNGPGGNMTITLYDCAGAQ